MVFSAVSVIGANMPKNMTEPDKIVAPDIVVTNKKIALASDIDSRVLLRTSLTLPKSSQLQAQSTEPAPTPLVLADVSVATQQDTYEHIEKGTYQSEAGYTTQIYSESIRGYSHREKLLIARVVYSEARGEPFEGQVAVAAVVLNRYESGKFGKSISKIVFAPDQFAITEKYNASGMAAAEAAIANRDTYPDNMFFFQVSKSRTWRNFVYYKRIGGHSFYCAAK